MALNVSVGDFLDIDTHRVFKNGSKKWTLLDVKDGRDAITLWVKDSNEIAKGNIVQVTGISSVSITHNKIAGKDYINYNVKAEIIKADPIERKFETTDIETLPIGTEGTEICKSPF